GAREGPEIDLAESGVVSGIDLGTQGRCLGARWRYDLAETAERLEHVGVEEVESGYVVGVCPDRRRDTKLLCLRMVGLGGAQLLFGRLASRDGADAALVIVDILIDVEVLIRADRRQGI